MTYSMEVSKDGGWYMDQVTGAWTQWTRWAWWTGWWKQDHLRSGKTVLPWSPVNTIGMIFSLDRGS